MREELLLTGIAGFVPAIAEAFFTFAFSVLTEASYWDNFPSHSTSLSIDTLGGAL